MDTRPGFHGRPPNTGFCFSISGLLDKKVVPNLRADFTDPDRCGRLVLNTVMRAGEISQCDSLPSVHLADIDFIP